MTGTMIIQAMVSGQVFMRQRVNLATGEKVLTHRGLLVEGKPQLCSYCGDPAAVLTYQVEFATDDITKELYCPTCRSWVVLDKRYASELSLEQWFCLLTACGLSDAYAIVEP